LKWGTKLEMAVSGMMNEKKEVVCGKMERLEVKNSE
jgi:hypothetical protein